MTIDEKDLINEKFKNVHDKIDNNQDILLQKLNSIEKQTTKTNGTVIRHQDEIDKLKVSEITHVINCPVAVKVDKIEGELMEYKFFKKYPKLFLVSVGLMAIFVLFEVFTKILPL